MAQIKFSDHLRRWREQGWHIERTNGGHLRCTHSKASNIVFIPSNPKEWRSLENMESQLRKALRNSVSTPKQPPVVATPAPALPKPVQAPVAAAVPRSTPETPKAPRAKLAPEIIGAIQFLIMRIRCDGGTWKTVRVGIKRFRNDPQYREGCIKAYHYTPGHQLRILRGRLRAGEGLARETGQPVPPPKLGKLTLGKPLARHVAPVIPGLRTVEINRSSRQAAHSMHTAQREVRPPREQQETVLGMAFKAALDQRNSSLPMPPKIETPKAVMMREAPTPEPVKAPEPVVSQAPPPVQPTEAVILPKISEATKSPRKPVAPLPLIARQAAKGLMETVLAVAPPKKRRAPPRPVVADHTKLTDRNASRDADILDRFANKKLSAMQIAEHHGVSVAVVSKVIKNAHKSVSAPSSNVVVLRIPEKTRGAVDTKRMVATGGGKR